MGSSFKQYHDLYETIDGWMTNSHVLLIAGPWLLFEHFCCRLSCRACFLFSLPVLSSFHRFFYTLPPPSTTIGGVEDKQNIELHTVIEINKVH